MNAEQRAALERVARMQNETYQQVYGHSWDTRQAHELYHADLVTVSRLALSQHQADDGEAVTVEWLLGLGFTRRMCGRMGIDFAMGVLMDDGDNPDDRWVIAGESGPIPRFDGVVDVLKNPTKGQVRKLLESLPPTQGASQ